MRVDGSRIQKEKVADSKISRYMWTRALDVMENLITGKKIHCDQVTEGKLGVQTFVNLSICNGKIIPDLL